MGKGTKRGRKKGHTSFAKRVKKIIHGVAEKKLVIEGINDALTTSTGGIVTRFLHSAGVDEGTGVSQRVGREITHTGAVVRAMFHNQDNSVGIPHHGNTSTVGFVNWRFIVLELKDVFTTLASVFQSIYYVRSDFNYEVVKKVFYDKAWCMHSGGISKDSLDKPFFVPTCRDLRFRLKPFGSIEYTDTSKTSSTRFFYIMAMNDIVASGDVVGADHSYEITNWYVDL